MRIDGPGTTARQGAIDARLRAATTDRAFAPSSPGAATRPATPVPVVASSPATSMTVMVALATLDPAVERRRRQAVDAERGVRLLETLRDQLETGTATPRQWAEMRAWLDRAAKVDDPVLDAILRDVDLRLRVELAKQEGGA